MYTLRRFGWIDQLKVLRMALIHDLPEAIPGDLTPDRKAKETRGVEDTAMNQLFSLLSKGTRGRHLTDWDEYIKGTTREARAIRHFEKLEMALQARKYEQNGKGDLGEFARSAELTRGWPQIKKLLSCSPREQR